MYERPPLFSAHRPSPKDFLKEGLVWHPSLFPWFWVNVKVSDQDRKGRLDDQVLMISTLEGLKEVLGQGSELFTVESIDYVTPGFMNETGRWQIESLVEITELSNDGGWGIPRCKVNDKRVYRELSLEPVPDFWNEQVIFRDKKSK